MRMFAHIIGFFAGFAGIASACAADLPRAPDDRNVGLHYSAQGHRASPIVIYDYQPGVYVRAYWRAPWRHKHYFPATGEQPITVSLTGAMFAGRSCSMLSLCRRR